MMIILKNIFNPHQENEKRDIMNIVVLGAGAIGGFYGALLTRQGENVTFIARGKNLEHLQNHDLHIESIWGDFSVSVKAVAASDIPSLDPCDVVILAVKSTALKDVIPQIKELISEKTKILCLLNGIGNEEILAEEFGADRVIGGSAFVSTIFEKPGLIQHVAEGKIVMGDWTKERSKVVNQLAEVFRNLGVEIEVSDNIQQAKWEKLLWNICFNPITALTQTKVGVALNNQDIFPIMKRIQSEYLAVAKAYNIHFDPEQANWIFEENEDAGNHKTSMLQDFESGKKMELDAIMGYVIKLAHEKDIPVATIETIYHLLRFAENEANKN